MIKTLVSILFFVLVIPSIQLYAQSDLSERTPSEIPLGQEVKSIVTGRVSDAESGDFLDNVNVFLSFTTIGTSTAKDGSFKLTNIPVGVFDLVVSRIGYERQFIILQIGHPDSFHYEIKLKSQILQTNEVEVIAESPEEWKQNLKKFVKAFIGETENAKYCKILNPEVLNLYFDGKTDTLIASSDSILCIDNYGLGYRIHFILNQFVWDVKKDAGHYLLYTLFEELQPQAEKEYSNWVQNRNRTYKGSLKHFLCELNSKDTDLEMFSIFSGPLKNLARGFGHRVSPDEFQLIPQHGTPFKLLQFLGHLRIEYGRVGSEFTGGKKIWERATKRWIDNPNITQNVTANIINLKNSYALIDTLGNLFNPLAIEVSGTWAKKRVAELLPMD
ncbi:MAG: carboxypeptidase-like regulatory domain-containing protein [Bacteroidota bacterium]|nr:carboxypeptidase-like regulatory domain-containing protein [Bacteroidota bacterium]